jgi:hypothetical protein
MAGKIEPEEAYMRANNKQEFAQFLKSGPPKEMV